jgi:hypothetical protein
MPVQISEYEKQANDLLAKFGITFKVELIGKDCPRYCEDAIAERDMDKLDTYPRKTHIHGKHYSCFFVRNLPDGDHTSMFIDFWNSYADEEYNWARLNPDKLSFDQLDRIFSTKMRNSHGVALRARRPERKVSAYDVLACLTKSEPGTFDDFCGEYGYSSDSMRAHETWKAVRAEWRKVQGFFLPDEITAIQEVQ